MASTTDPWTVTQAPAFIRPHVLAAPGCPVAGELPRCPVALAPTRGFRGAAVAFGVAPSGLCDAGCSLPSWPGDRVSPPRGADHAVSGSPDPAIELSPDVFPMTDSRQPARGSRTGGASGSLAFASTVMTLGSPWPSRSPHRVDSSAFSGSRVPCPRVLLSCSTIPTRAGLVYIVIVPTGLPDPPVDCSNGGLWAHSQTLITVARNARLSSSSYDVSFEFPKIAPPLSWEPRSPRPTRTSPCSLRRQVANPPRAPPSWFEPPWRFTPPRPGPGVAPDFQSWGS